MRDFVWITAIIFSLILLAGCTIPGTNIELPEPGGGTTTTTIPGGGVIRSTEVSGVELEITTSPSTIYEESSFTLMATVKNLGSETAKDVTIQAAKESGDFTLDESEKSLGDLEPPIKERIIPTYQTWDVTAGKRSGKINVRVKYSYSTKTAADIQIYDLDKLKMNKDLMEEAQSSPGILSFEGSKAPVKVSVQDAGPYYYTSTHTRDKIIFSIENVGNGIVKDNKIKTTIKIGDSYCKNGEDVDLKFVGSTEIICDFDLPKPTDYKTTIPFDVSLEYSYEITGSKSIQILSV